MHESGKIRPVASYEDWKKTWDAKEKNKALARENNWSTLFGEHPEKVDNKKLLGKVHVIVQKIKLLSTSEKSNRCEHYGNDHFFARRGFLNRKARKGRGSSTTTTNAEVMSIQPDTCDVIGHVQW